MMASAIEHCKPHRFMQERLKASRRVEIAVKDDRARQNLIGQPSCQKTNWLDTMSCVLAVKISQDSLTNLDAKNEERWDVLEHQYLVCLGSDIKYETEQLSKTTAHCHLIFKDTLMWCGIVPRLIHTLSKHHVGWKPFASAMSICLRYDICIWLTFTVTAAAI